MPGIAPSGNKYRSLHAHAGPVVDRWVAASFNYLITSAERGPTPAQAAFCGDSEVIRRAFGCCASTKVVAKDEGEAFLQKAPSEDERLDADGGLHPGLDAAFRHVEKLEASMLHKSAR